MSLEKEGDRRPEVFAFGDWEGYINRADLRCRARIVATMAKLRAKAISRGILRPQKEEKLLAAFDAVEGLIRYAVEWCQHEQDRGTCINSPFTEDREAEVIVLVCKVLDAIPNMLAYDGVGDNGLTEKERFEVTRDCEIRKANFAKDLIRPRFYDGRADFQPAKATTPSLASGISAESNPGENESFAFYPDGSGFHIAGFGEQGHVSKLKGFRQIYQLIQTPNKPISMLALVEADGDERIANDMRSVQPVLDERAKRELVNRIAEVKTDLEQAKLDNNNVEVEHCQKEIELCNTSLLAATGFGGRDRDLNTNRDRLRAMIAGTIKTALGKLQAASPPMKLLADHFDLSIFADGTGKAYIYQPALDPPPKWATEPKK